MKQLPKRTPGLPGQLLLLALLSGFSTAVVLWVQPVSFIYLLKNMLRLQPHLLLLNWLPLFLTALALGLLLQNTCYGAALSHFIWGVLSLANRVKITVRDEPVYPSDLGLLKEVADAMGNYNITFPWVQIAVVLLSTAAMAALGLILRQRRVEGKAKRRLLRFGGCAAALGVLAALILTLYASPTLYRSFYCSYFDHITVVYNELGFPYCFCYNFSTYRIEKPEGFDKAEAAAYEEGGTESHLAPNVHVIFIMNEAFSDLTDRDVFLFEEGDDPLTNFHALQQSPNALSGYLVVPNFAGGTANTEFDVLTGMQTTMLSQSSTSAFRTFTRNMDSILRVFQADGYHTSFIHPGNDWFYNRENVYRWLGAEETYFVDQMEDPAYKGSWVTDDYTAAFLERQFEAAVAAGETLCNLTVTIQNHMSYTADKYGDAVIPAVKTAVSVSQETETMLSVYTEGIRDADAMLGRLTAYFSQTDEPVVLVFYGDHLPHLGDDRLGYRELGLDVADGDAAADPFCSYRTPYLIWCNDAGAAALDFADAAEALALPQGGSINASYLGAAVLELTGRSGESPWFDFLNALRREMPVYRNGAGLTAEGELFTEPPESLAEAVNKLKSWTYYKIKYKTVT
ncbi:MAG: LTA synthase family protein [Oscillospiraceae bacterium]